MPVTLWCHFCCQKVFTHPVLSVLFFFIRQYIVSNDYPVKEHIKDDKKAPFFTTGLILPTFHLQKESAEPISNQGSGCGNSWTEHWHSRTLLRIGCSPPFLIPFFEKEKAPAHRHSSTPSSHLCFRTVVSHLKWILMLRSIHSCVQFLPALFFPVSCMGEDMYR